VSVAFDLDLDLVPGCPISRVFCEKWVPTANWGPRTHFAFEISRFESPTVTLEKVPQTGKCPRSTASNLRS
jgi:hypothetical protein